MSMSFTAQERTALLACKGVGPKVIERLEQMGFSALAQLREASVDDIVAQGRRSSDQRAGKTVLRQKLLLAMLSRWQKQYLRENKGPENPARCGYIL
jgi:predicted Fe-Mo cluster-binding NifX family protein